MRSARLPGLADRRADRGGEGASLSLALWRRLPAAGEVAIFDRGWYGRVLSSGSKASPARPSGAAPMTRSTSSRPSSPPTAAPSSSSSSISRPRPGRAPARRLDHPRKRWKVNAEDLRSRGRRKDYVEAIKDMFEHTDMRWAPWTVIDGNDKKSARIAALTRSATRWRRRCRPTRRRSVPKWKSWHGNCRASGIDGPGPVERRICASRIVDRDHFIFVLADGEGDPPRIADRGAAKGAGDRRIADPAAGVRFVLADQGEGPPAVVLVGDGHGGAEPDPAPVGLAAGSVTRALFIRFDRKLILRSTSRSRRRPY